MTYLQLLKDPRWQKKRLLIFNRDGWACRKCNSSIRTLQVHHLWYKENTDPWDYPDEALITFCDVCHEKAELIKWILRYGLKNLQAEGFLYRDCFDIYTTVRKEIEANDHPESVRRYMENIRLLMSNDFRPSYSFING